MLWNHESYDQLEKPFQAHFHLIKTTYENRLDRSSVLDSLLHLLRVKENTWIAGRSRLWPWNCTLATSGDPTHRWTTGCWAWKVTRSFGNFWGFLGIFGDLHKAVLGFAPCFPWSCWKSQAFPNHLGIQGALFDPTWSVQTGGRRRRMLRPWQPREFASSFTTPFRKILHFFGGRDVPLKSNEWKIPLNSHPKPWFLVWFVRISGITGFLQSTCAKKHTTTVQPQLFSWFSRCWFYRSWLGRTGTASRCGEFNCRDSCFWWETSSFLDAMESGTTKPIGKRDTILAL